MLRLQQIDESNISDHYWIESTDTVYYLRERNHGTWSAGETNQLIHNVKIKPTESSNRIYYKNKAIRQVVNELSAAVNVEWAKTQLFVPVPPSKAIGHEDYDPRLILILENLFGGGLKVSELVVQDESMEAAHESANRPSKEELLEAYSLNQNVATVEDVTGICVFDDVISAGSHFWAMKATIALRYPGVPVTGLFVARQRQDDREPVEFPDFDPDDLSF